MTPAGELALKLLGAATAPPPCKSCVMVADCAANETACADFAGYADRDLANMFRRTPMRGINLRAPTRRIYRMIFRPDDGITRARVWRGAIREASASKKAL